MKLSNKVKWGIVTVVVIALALTYTVSKNKKHVSEILNSPSITTGTLTKIRYEKGKTTLGDYTFTVGNIQINSVKGDGRFQEMANKLMNRNFPVIYNSKDPSKNDLLIFSSDFEKYHLKFPDSLIWVEKKMPEIK
jgi:hypothetical protein